MFNLYSVGNSLVNIMSTGTNSVAGGAILNGAHQQTWVDRARSLVQHEVKSPNLNSHLPVRVFLVIALSKTSCLKLP